VAPTPADSEAAPRGLLDLSSDVVGNGREWVPRFWCIPAEAGVVQHN